MTLCKAVPIGDVDQRGWQAKQCTVCGSLYKPMPPGKFEAECSGVQSQRGPGSHLQILLTSLGARPDKCRNSCQKVAKIMDDKGVEWCKENKPRLVKHLKEAYSKLAWHDVATFAARAVASGLAFKIGFQDAAEWLVEEAIRRSEAQQMPSEHNQSPAP